MTHSRSSIESAWDKGERPEIMLFWGHQPKKGGRIARTCFSQWFVAPIEIDGIVYPTNEHWMMAGKARLFGDDQTLAEIIAAATPNEAKALGRKVRNFDPAKWDSEKRRIVTEGNLAKFSQHADLREFLLGTGDAVIVEASPFDAIWGIGLGMDDPRALDPAQWRGENLLGFVLMDVRDQLAADTSS